MTYILDKAIIIVCGILIFGSIAFLGEKIIKKKRVNSAKDICELLCKKYGGCEEIVRDYMPKYPLLHIECKDGNSYSIIGD